MSYPSKYPGYPNPHDIERLEPRIRQWMANNAEDYDNPTALAEAAADQFLVDGWLDIDTHPIWDWSLKAADWDL